MTSSLFNPQFNDAAVTDAVNILAIEPLGHGKTSFPSKAAHFTYWDSAALALAVMDELKIEKAFAMGTSQGGWMVVRMALLAPERVSLHIIAILFVFRYLFARPDRPTNGDVNYTTFIPIKNRS